MCNNQSGLIQNKMIVVQKNSTFVEKISAKQISIWRFNL